jgi:hypothetical protein
MAPELVPLEESGLVSPVLDKFCFLTSRQSTPKFLVVNKVVDAMIDWPFH